MIEVKNVSKNYNNFQAVKDVSFSVSRAEVLGFLGPNGAGKTTIMKMLTAYHFPTQGQVIIDGIDVEDDPLEVKTRSGYLPENVPLYGDMTAEEYLRFTAAARLIPSKDQQRAVEKALSDCGISAVMRRRRTDSLSKGYRQRLGLAQAIVHDPPILILDEPTSGLDPNQIIEIRSLIRELGTRKTVILSTHIMQEVEAVCSRVLILNGGRIAAQGTPGEIAVASLEPQTPSLNEDSWVLKIKGAKADEVKSRLGLLALQAGAEISGVSVENLETHTLLLCFTIKGGAASGGENGELIFKWAVSQGYTIISMNRREPSLEEIFAKVTSE
ncbi:MAG: ATP-binding cassette domain-containing protein [Treponema sp.]|nr:ATP-binding cassette domain-containing protein [Treponema sp.]